MDSLVDTPSYLDCVLITGASSGIGREFARQLAPISDKLVLVARREERLLSLYDELTKENPNLEVSILSANLALEDERVELCSILEHKKITPTLLINNAGLGDYGEFASSDWTKIQAMLDVNMIALTHLTYLLLPIMKENGAGAIINVSSLASLVPMPDFAVYAATKAYVTSFSEGLRTELQEDGIPVVAVCPGPVHTEFGEVAAREGAKFDIKGYESLRVSPQKVVTESLNALFKNRARVYPSVKVALFAAVLTALPIFAVRMINSKRLRRSTPVDYESGS